KAALRCPRDVCGLGGYYFHAKESWLLAYDLGNTNRASSSIDTNVRGRMICLVTAKSMDIRTRRLLGPSPVDESVE
ncbi:hypothetical protein ACHAP5_011481, partial [Fusarium lateritium]